MEIQDERSDGRTPNKISRDGPVMNLRLRSSVYHVDHAGRPQHLFEENPEKHDHDKRSKRLMRWREREMGITRVRWGLENTAIEAITDGGKSIDRRSNDRGLADLEGFESLDVRREGGVIGCGRV